MTPEQLEQLRMQLSALHATATALLQQVAVALSGLPAPENGLDAVPKRARRPVAHDLPADLND